MVTHPNDTLAALEWAIRAALVASVTDDMVRLVYLPALQELRDGAQREARA